MMMQKNIWLGQLPMAGAWRPRRLGQTTPPCPEMSQDAWKAVSQDQKEVWEDSGKNTLASICATVSGRIMQECRFPDGYASAQNVGAGDAPPASCDLLWADRQKGAGLSGRGRRGLGQADAAKVLTDKTIGEALSAPKAVLMLYSPNCPYSRAFMPIFQAQAAAAAASGGTLFATINVLENPESALKYNVSMLPTVVFLVNGQAVNRIDGVQEQGDFMGEMGRAFSGSAQAQSAGAKAPPRSGTLMDSQVEPQGLSTGTYVLGGVLGAGLLGLVGYLAFGK